MIDAGDSRQGRVSLRAGICLPVECSWDQGGSSLCSPCQRASFARIFFCSWLCLIRRNNDGQLFVSSHVSSFFLCFVFLPPCVYTAAFLGIAPPPPPGMFPGGEPPPTCLPPLGDPTDGGVRSKLYSGSSHPRKMRLEGPTLPGSLQSASWRSVMCPPCPPCLPFHHYNLPSFPLAFRFPTWRTNMWELLDFTLACLWSAEWWPLRRCAQPGPWSLCLGYITQQGTWQMRLRLCILK